MRKLPKSFFWIDQEIVRCGVWMKLGCQARLAYIAIAASCDRDGITIWSRNKLMELSGIKEPEEWKVQLAELIGHKLIEILPESCPPSIRIFSLNQNSCTSQEVDRIPTRTKSQTQPIVIHTHTSIHICNEKATHAESGTTD